MKNPNRQVWFISDTHFGHDSIRDYCRPRFATTAEMNDCMITNWRETVGPNDLVYHLGDFSMSSAVAAEVRPKLTGTIRLIVGNHDDPLKLAKLDLFQRISLWRTFPEYGFHATHAPMRINQLRHSKLNLHGHTHGEPSGLEYFHRDVSVELTDYKPVSCWTLKKLASSLSDWANAGRPSHEE